MMIIIIVIHFIYTALLQLSKTVDIKPNTEEKYIVLSEKRKKEK